MVWYPLAAGLNQLCRNEVTEGEGGGGEDVICPVLVLADCSVFTIYGNVQPHMYFQCACS